MGLHLEFEPHSWYMGFAIKDDRNEIEEDYPWYAVYANGMTYAVIEINSTTLTELKQRIKDYWKGE